MPEFPDPVALPGRTLPGADARRLGRRNIMLGPASHGPNAKVTQTYFESVVNPIPNARVTQTISETIVAPIPNGRVTMVYTETVVHP